MSSVESFQYIILSRFNKRQLKKLKRQQACFNTSFCLGSISSQICFLVLPLAFQYIILSRFNSPNSALISFKSLVSIHHSVQVQSTVSQQFFKSLSVSIHHSVQVQWWEKRDQPKPTFVSIHHSVQVQYATKRALMMGLRRFNTSFCLGSILIS